MYFALNSAQEEKLVAIKIFVYFLSLIYVLHDNSEEIGVNNKKKGVLWAHTHCKKKKKVQIVADLYFGIRPEVGYSRQLRIRKRVEDFSVLKTFQSPHVGNVCICLTANRSAV